MKYLFIDEFQDSDLSQIKVACLLSKILGSILFVVGDVKQSIYRFRGADVAVFNALSKDFKEGNIWMATNHRSHPELISAFNTIFGGSVYGSKSAKNVNFETTPPAVFYTEKQQKGIKTYMKSYVKNNKGKWTKQEKYMFFKKDKYYKAAMEEAAKQRELDAKKARLLSKDMDYAFLEEIIQKMNENPLLQVRITLKDGTVLDCNTKPKKNPLMYLEPTEEVLEVR